MNSTIKAPWRNRFLNVVERTIMELNIEFTNYTIGQAAKGETKRRVFDKEIQGIEFADELTVCSAIVNDCIASPILSGDVETYPDRAPEMKYYEMGREEQYGDGTKHRVDITIRRVSQQQIFENAIGKASGKVVANNDPFKTVFIEAKRARRISNSSLSQEKLSGAVTSNELKQDLEKKLKIHFREDRFFYALVWGVFYSEELEADGITPKKYLDTLSKSDVYSIDKNDVRIRWLPLSWDTHEQLDEPKGNLAVRKWCWIMLVELNKK